MKTLLPLRRESPRTRAFALIWTLFFVAMSMLILSGALAWTANTARLTERNNQYAITLAAAEAATEKVVGQIMYDFRSGNQGRVYQNLGGYQALIPNEHAVWNNFQFSDPAGNANQIWVGNIYTNSYTNLDSQYAGLLGYASKYRVVAFAKNVNGMEAITTGVQQDVQVATIPIFQFTIFYNLLMEISCGQPFNIYGRVHGNRDLYVLPDSTLTFYDDVTDAGNIFFGRAPGDGRTPPAGTVTYQADKDARVTSLNLPIGTNNSSPAVHALLERPPAGEDPASPLGRQRFFNKAEMILTVTPTNILATSGRFNNFSTVLGSNDFNKFITLTNNFWDAREGKRVRPIDLDVGKFKTWCETNTNLRGAVGGEVSLVYVDDQRGLTTELGAVRLREGRNLPSRGLTVATPRPLYILGHYNCGADAALGTANTAPTKPAAVVADAIMVLSTHWADANSQQSLASRQAVNTTVNAAFLSGIVETAVFNSYSGGVENFPRFLEKWGSGAIFTYNGSMVVMFPSQYATNKWGMANVYDPPKRNWSFDQNFRDATKLPPGTPSVSTLIRCKWASLAPNSMGEN